MTVHDLDANRPHVEWPARCLACKHEWCAVAPVDHGWLECPSCHEMRGGIDMQVCAKCYGKGAFILESPDATVAWQCDCGASMQPGDGKDDLPHYAFRNRAITREQAVEAMASIMLHIAENVFSDASGYAQWSDEQCAGSAFGSAELAMRKLEALGVIRFGEKP